MGAMVSLTGGGCSACIDVQLARCAALVPPRQIGAFTVNEKGWKAANPPHGGLIVTTSIHPDPCKKPHGDRVNQLSVLNKLDYVKLHGYEFHLVTHVVDKSLPKLCGLSRHAQLRWHPGLLHSIHVAICTASPAYVATNACFASCFTAVNVPSSIGHVYEAARSKMQQESVCGTPLQAPLPLALQVHEDRAAEETSPRDEPRAGGVDPVARRRHAAGGARLPDTLLRVRRQELHRLGQRQTTSGLATNSTVCQHQNPGRALRVTLTLIPTSTSFQPSEPSPT